jgi:hypothetical protein
MHVFHFSIAGRDVVHGFLCRIHNNDGGGSNVQSENYLERILVNRFTSASGVIGVPDKICCVS